MKKVLKESKEILDHKEKEGYKEKEGLREYREKKEKDGEKGEVGPANVLTIGKVETGEEASANIRGNSPNQVLDLILPKGDKGDTGEIGPQGPKGDTGTLSDEQINVIKTEILKVQNPIGHIRMETTNTNPSTYLGFGTWVLWGAGRVPVGVDTTDTKFNTVEKMGGSNSASIAAHTHKVSGNVKSHTLTTEEIPAHKHNIESDGNAAVVVSDKSGWQKFASGNVNIGKSSNWNNTANTGGGKGHIHGIDLTSTSAGSFSVSTVQEYITCYMWKRTA